MNRHDTALSILNKGTVIPATPLVLDSNRRFDEYRQRRLIRYYLEAGAGGIATAVHSTQFAIRDKSVGLFDTVLRVVADEVDKYERETSRTIVKVAGVCGPIEQAVTEAKLARDLGYDAVLLSPGGLNHMSEDYMIERTEKVAEIMPTIGFYLQVACGGRAFSYDYWSRLSEIPNVVAIKCASFNRYLTLDVVRAVAMSSRQGEIALYTGNDDNIVCDLMSKYTFVKDGKEITENFRGGLLGHWCVWTHKAVELFNAIKSGNVDNDYMKLATAITDANGVIFDSRHGFKGCIPGIHEVLRRQGLLDGIWCIDPKETLSPDQSAELDRIALMYPNLNDDDFVKDFLNKYERI